MASDATVLAALGAVVDIYEDRVAGQRPTLSASLSLPQLSGMRGGGAFAVRYTVTLYGGPSVSRASYILKLREVLDAIAGMPGVDRSSIIAQQGRDDRTPGALVVGITFDAGLI